MIETPDSFTPVKWILLTDVNETNWEKFELDIGRFLKGLSRCTKCHIRAPSGLEKYGNTHAHIIIEIPTSEIARFKFRYMRFKPDTYWSHRKYNIHDWEPGSKTRSYAMKKHSLWFDCYCPRYYRSCRNGNCDIFTKKHI